MKTLLLCGAAVALAASSVSADAALVNAPLPSNTFIHFGNLDWAWASPCSPTGCVGGQDALDLSYQGPLGWRLPTAAELAAGPAASDFVFRGANVPFGGADANGTTFSGSPPSDAACAAAYFTAGYFNHCDYGDGLLGAVYGNPDYAGVANVETWVVRGAIPEPGSWAMMVGGLALAGMVLRRRKVSVRFA